MTRWEYRRHTAKINLSEPSLGEHFYLSAWGREGWEIVGYSAFPEAGSWYEVVLAKRQLTDP